MPQKCCCQALVIGHLSSLNAAVLGFVYSVSDPVLLIITGLLPWGRQGSSHTDCKHGHCARGGSPMCQKRDDFKKLRPNCWSRGHVFWEWSRPSKGKQSSKTAYNNLIAFPKHEGAFEVPLAFGETKEHVSKCRIGPLTMYFLSAHPMAMGLHRSTCGCCIS